MAIETVERPRTIRFDPNRDSHSNRAVPSADFEPNFGPEDVRAIKAIFGIIVGVLIPAVLMYGTIALLAALEH